MLRAHGLWRSYYVDHGAAYVARSLKVICAELDIRLLHDGRGDAAAKGSIERWHRTWRDEVEDELPDEPIPIFELEEKHRAWLACDYHARKHDTTGRALKEHWLELCDHLRALPRDIDLDELFPPPRRTDGEQHRHGALERKPVRGQSRADASEGGAALRPLCPREARRRSRGSSRRWWSRPR